VAQILGSDEQQAKLMDLAEKITEGGLSWDSWTNSKE
jgi:hypothetical protein